MIGIPDKPDAQALDAAITRVLDLMAEKDPGSEEYQSMLEDLERLTKLRSSNAPERVSRNTIAIVAGNLLGILVIVAVEQNHVMNSKGLGFVLKTKPQ